MSAEGYPLLRLETQEEDATIIRAGLRHAFLL